MSVLSAAQSAALRTVRCSLPTLFGSTDQIALEFIDLANECAAMIARDHDWQRLLKLHTVTGDGTAEAFPMPADYARMPLKANVFSTRSRFPFVPARDLDQWLEFEITPVVAAPGFWILIGGQLNIKPALGAAETARFFYLSDRIVSGDQATFSANEDAFLLDERLLTLAMVWRWKAQKGLEYGEDMTNYNSMFAALAGKERGSRMLAVGGATVPYGARVAYPGTI